jgi:biopolymer transport protein ExbD
MADIAFLLIIYFLVTAAFVTARGLDFKLPREVEATSIEPEEAVLVDVLGDGTLQVDRRAVQLGDLLETLRPKLVENPDKPVIVKSSLDAPYGATVDVLDELRQGRGRLGLDREINVSLPTDREARSLWLVASHGG